MMPTLSATVGVGLFKLGQRRAVGLMYQKDMWTEMQWLMGSKIVKHTRKVIEVRESGLGHKW